jgi:hypothetical protein
LGKHLFDVVCPEAAEEAEGKRIAEEEEQARRRAWFTMRDRGDGSHEGRFVLPDLQAHVLRAALEALLAPRNNHTKPTGSGAGRDAGAGNDAGARAGAGREAASAGAACPGEDSHERPDKGDPEDATRTDHGNADADADGDADGRGGDGGEGVPCRVPIPYLDPVTGDRVPYQSMLGRAFLELLEHLDPTGMPSHAGGPFTLVVTIGYQDLIDRLGTAILHTGDPHGPPEPDTTGGDEPSGGDPPGGGRTGADSGSKRPGSKRPGGRPRPGLRISAGQARRLACTAGIIPMVLGGDSMPLDLGREKRLFTRYQRIALAHTHHGCAAKGCDRSPDWVEIHHDNPWRSGGATDLDNAIPLCPTHHHMADHPETYALTELPNGKVAFTQR